MLPTMIASVWLCITQQERKRGASMRYDYEDTEDYVLHRLFLIISILLVIKC